MTHDPLGVRARVALGETTRYCTATNRKGEPCGLPPIKGGFVCHLHGGNAPQVRRSAKERLLGLIDPAMHALLRALRSGEPCKVCGRSDADRDPAVIRAAQIVLDRTGFHPAVAVQVARTESRPTWVSWLTDEQLSQVSVWITDAKRRMQAGEARPLALPPASRLLGDDALVVDDGDEDDLPVEERR